MKHTITMILLAICLSGCTIVKYSDRDTSLIVADVRMTGSAIDLSGAITGVGTLQVNREQGSAEGIVTSAVDAVTGGVLSEVLP